jgi:ubiquinone/menaquinone biosynthesis C-methylase UbiE
MAQLEFDEAVVRQLEAVYRTRDVLRRRALVREALAARPGERIVDVGCGPGFYVAELLDAVGPEGHVLGVDTSADMLAVAARRNEGRANAALREGDATALPAGDGEFDAAVSVQVLEYVPDVDAALAELHRVLRPGGRVVLWDVDWATLSMRAADPARTERVLRAWDEHLADPVLPRTLAPRLRAAGFTDVAAEGHAFTTAEFTPQAYSAALVPIVHRYVTEQDLLPADEVAAWVAEQAALGERGEYYASVTQVCFTATRPG